MNALVRKRLVFKGRVQGVGFRPTIYNLAKKMGLSGVVLNSPEGVIVEVEGEGPNIDKFLEYVKTKQPPNAKVTRIEETILPSIGYMGFRIMPSASTGSKTVLISPDLGTCKECEKELFNPRDRRFGYPFINCTHCGPRFSIIKDIPYDRARTTMSVFHMCSLCEFEYSDPGNRRFHAEPNACDDCGPHLFLLDANGKRVETLDPILKAVQLVKEGKIVAIKGIGGYQIICDASNNQVIEELRKRKNRPFKPFAVMSYSMKEIRSYSKVNDKESTLLQSSARPIVLLKKRKQILISEQIAPGLNNIGAMLPYSPLHFLILKDNLIAMIVTSANKEGEPIIKDDDKVVNGLKGIAEYFLVHDRKIRNRSDDSVLQVIKNKPVMLRRSRGYVPDPVKISDEGMPNILGVGGQMKNTFTVTRGKGAYMSQFIGDLDNAQSFDFFKKSANKFAELLKVKPTIVAHDLHPEYVSTKFAKSLHGVTLMPVQHHHAHIASVMAEHNISSDVIGVAFDGMGYGDDGAIWGGEFFAGGHGRFQRMGHLKYVQQPGGDIAAKEPYRMAFSYLYDAFGEDLFKLKIEVVKKYKKEFETFSKMSSTGVNSHPTSSMGRLFDAVASIIGVRDISTYEGQAAIELESIALGKGYKSYDFEILENNVLDTSSIIKGIVADLSAGIIPDNISYKFHNTIAKALAKICKTISKDMKLKKVCLSGGVFQNALLVEAALRELKKMRLEVYINEKVPANDGGISLGQVRFAKDVLSSSRKG